MDALDTRISQWLRDTRRAKGWDLRRLYANSWTPISVLSQIEREDKAATMQTVVRLCHGFEIAPATFVAEIGLGEIAFENLPKKVSLLDAGRLLRSVRKRHRVPQTAFELTANLQRNVLGRIEAGKLDRLSFTCIAKLEQQFPGENILPMFWAAYNTRIQPYFVVYERPSGICTWSAEADDPDHLIRGLLRQHSDILQITSMEVDTWPNEPNQPLKVTRYNLWIQERKA